MSNTKPMRKNLASSISTSVRHPMTGKTTHRRRQEIQVPRQTFPNKGTNARSRADKARNLRRKDIRFLVKHCFVSAPPASIMAGLLDLLGCRTSVHAVQRDYRALRLTPA